MAASALSSPPTSDSSTSWNSFSFYSPCFSLYLKVSVAASRAISRAFLLPRWFLQEILNLTSFRCIPRLPLHADCDVYCWVRRLFPLLLLSSLPSLKEHFCHFNMQQTTISSNSSSNRSNRSTISGSFFFFFLPFFINNNKIFVTTRWLWSLSLY